MIREFLRHLSLELYRSPQTVEAYASDLRGFNDFMHKAGVKTDNAGFFIPSLVGTADIREWVAQMSEEGIAATSLRRKIQSLRAYYKFLVQKKIVADNPALAVPLPKKSRKLPEITSASEVEDIISETEKIRNSLIIEMLFGLGLRRAELLDVTDSDINFYSGELRVRGKGAKIRIVPLPQELKDKISTWQRERDALYPNLPAPRPLISTAHGAMSPSNLYKIVRGALGGTSAAKKSPHTLRHTFATSMLNAGADINSVKDLMGHASLAATQIYTHLAFGDLKNNWQKAHPRAKKTDSDP